MDTILSRAIKAKKYIISEIHFKEETKLAKAFDDIQDLIDDYKDMQEANEHLLQVVDKAVDILEKDNKYCNNSCDLTEKHNCRDCIKKELLNN